MVVVENGDQLESGTYDDKGEGRPVTMAAGALSTRKFIYFHEKAGDRE